MTTALIVSAAPGMDLRLAQVLRLYREIGVTCDFIQLSPAEPDATGAASPYCPAHRSHGRGDLVRDQGHAIGTGALVALIRRFDTLRGPAFLHLDRIAPEPALGAALADLTAGGVLVTWEPDLAALAQVPPPGFRPGLILTATDRLRDRCLPLGAEVIRFPEEIPATPPPRPASQGFAGWAGRWDAALAEAWRGLLYQMSVNSVLPSCRLLLLGPGAARVGMPENPLRILRRETVSATASAALDVAILPEGGEYARRGEMLETLARGTPVLCLRAAAEDFSDRWRLPVAADLAGLARLIGELLPHWPGDAPHDDLTRGVAETRREILRDLTVMEEVIRARLLALRGSTQRPRLLADQGWV